MVLFVFNFKKYAFLSKQARKTPYFSSNFSREALDFAILPNSKTESRFFTLKKEPLHTREKVRSTFSRVCYKKPHKSFSAIKDKFLKLFYFEKSVYSIGSTLENSIVKIQVGRWKLDLKTAKQAGINSSFKMTRFRQSSFTVLL